jgi:two-component system chemotaxis response regulator CheB
VRARGRAAIASVRLVTLTRAALRNYCVSSGWRLGRPHGIRHRVRASGSRGGALWLSGWSRCGRSTVPGHDVVVIGASAGGMEATREVVRRLPADLEASVFVVLHLPSGARSRLPEILTRSGPIPATHPADAQRIERGQIYVAPPDHQMMLDDGQIRVVRGPRHNRHRPAADPLFQSAARSYGARVIGIVLSGTLDDGSAGIVTIKKLGGVAVVQDPGTAQFSGMPQSAASQVKVDYSLPIEEIGPMVARLVREPASATRPQPDEWLEKEFRRFLA